MRSSYFTSRSPFLWVVTAVSSAALGLGACNNDSAPAETPGSDAEVDASAETLVDGSSEAQTDTVGPMDTTPPTFGGVKGATPQDDTAIVVSWDPASDDTTPVAKIGYRVYLSKTSGGFDFTKPAVSTPAGATQTTVANLNPLTQYFVVVRAVDEAGNEDKNVVEAKTSTVDHIGPYFAGVTSVKPAAKGEIVVAWDTASDKETPKNEIIYRIFLSKTAGGQDFTTPRFTTTGGVLTHTITGLDDYQNYFVVVRAVDKSGNEEKNTKEVSALTIDATAPVFAGATTAAASGVTSTIKWAAATDNVTPQTDLVYRVYRSTTAGTFDFTAPFATTAAGATEATALGLTISTTYYWVVRSVDQFGNEDTNTKEVSATTDNKSDVTPPTFAGATPVTGITAHGGTANWLAGTDNVADPATLVYDVWFSTTPGGHNFSSPSATSPAGATSLPLTGLLPNTLYYVVVRARDPSGNSDANTVEVSFTTAADQQAPTFDGVRAGQSDTPLSVSLSWDAATDDTSAGSKIFYRVYRHTTNAPFAYTLVGTTIAGATGITFATGLTSETDYFWAVRAVDEFGNEDANTKVIKVSTVADTTKPTFGGATAPVDTVSVSSIRVNWNPATDNVTATAAITYKVCCSTVPGTCAVPTFPANSSTTSTTTTAPGATSLTIGSLPAATQYYCVARAFDAKGLTDGNNKEVTGSTAADTTAPRTNSKTTYDGALPFAGATATTLTAAWGPAVDDVTAPANIKYYVCLSDTANACTTSFGAGLGKLFVGPLTNVFQTTFNGLTTDKTYYAVVRAEDSANNRDLNTNQVSAKTTTDTTKPYWTGTPVLTQTANTVNSISLSWPAATDNVGVTGYDLCYIEGNATYCNTFVATKSFGNVLTGTVTGLPAGKTFYAKLRARDAAGLTSDGSPTGTPTITTTLGTISTQADGQAPTLGGLLQFSLTNSTGSTGTWTAGSDNDTVGALTYEYCIATSAGCNPGTWTTVTPTATSKAVSGLSAATTYHMRVRARDASNLTSTPLDGSFTTSPDTSPPTIGAITGAAKTPSVCNSATISYTAAADAESATVTYEFCAAGTTTGCNGGSWVTAASISRAPGSGPFNIAIPSLASTSNYYFFMRVKNVSSVIAPASLTYTAFGPVSLSDGAVPNVPSVTASPSGTYGYNTSCTPENAYVEKVNLNWGAVTESGTACNGGSIKYRICRRTPSESATKCDAFNTTTYPLAWEQSTNSATLDTAGATPNVTNYYYVRAVDGYGNVSANASSAINVFTKPSLSSGTVAAGGIQATWSGAPAAAGGGCNLGGCHDGTSSTVWNHATAVSPGGLTGYCDTASPNRIVPGSAATSTMYLRVIGTCYAGSIMPPTYTVPIYTTLASFKANLQTWINAGACNN